MAAIRRTLEVGETDHEQLICCLLALEIADYDAKPVFDQVRLTQEFHNLLEESKVGAGANDLVSVVGEDGALLDFFSDAQECFTTALMLREATLTQDRYRDLPLRIGINLGKAEIAADEFGNPHVRGEGALDADRLMRLGPPRQISVARPFVELLSRTAPELADLLEYEGTDSDAVDPSLGLYRVSPPRSTRSEDQPTTNVSLGVEDSARRLPVASTAQPQSRADSGNQLRRLWLGYAPLAISTGAAMVLLSGRLHVGAPASVPAAATSQTTTSAPIALRVPVLSEDAVHSTAVRPPAQARDTQPRPAASHRAESTMEVARAESAVEQRTSSVFNNATVSDGLVVSRETHGGEQPIDVAPVQDRKSGTLWLGVKPWGEVYVDGRKIGITPPLKTLDVPIGRHLITVTNGSLPIYRREVTVEPDTKIKVVHDFTCVSTRDSICREGFGKGLELRSRFTLETAQASEPLQPSRQ
jgi:hypothetical protein